MESDFLKKIPEKEKKSHHSYYDSATIYIKNENFITLKNNKINEKSILLESDKKEYTSSRSYYFNTNQKILTTIDLTNPVYNKVNYDYPNREETIIIEKDTIYLNNNKCSYISYSDNNEKLKEEFITCSDNITTNIKRNYLATPYIGQLLDTKLYERFKNKILYYYKLTYKGISYSHELLNIELMDIDNHFFSIPKTNKKGIIKE